MLIRKGNSFSFRTICTVLAALLLWCAAVPPTSAAPRPPDAVAVEFYGWYLETLAADQDPFSDRHERLAGYVARDLAARLRERLQSGRLPDSDYFLQAAHYDGNWLRQRVHAVTLRQRSRGREQLADVIVTLGAGGEPVRTLALAMVLEGGAWKIRHVNPAREDALHGAAEPAVI